MLKNKEQKYTNEKLTRLEKCWILYDIGNSSFSILVTSIIPMYFNLIAKTAGLSSTQYLSYWGYTISICTISSAIIGLFLGTLADIKNYKKTLFTISVLLGGLACASLSISKSWVLFLFLFIIAKVGHSSGNILNDAMLVDVTSKSRMDIVSSYGYAWGSIGCTIPFSASLILIFFSTKFGISTETAISITFVINAIWWIANTIPLIKTYKQIYHVNTTCKLFLNSFSRLFKTLKNIKREKNIFIFLLAYFFYIDVVFTIIDMATAYGEALGLKSNELLLALLATQVIAFPCAVIFAKKSKKYKTSSLIKICIFAYLAITLFAIQLHNQWEF